ncbi:AAA family ATPase [Flavonifractor sp. An9]|uniref:cytidylate kinase-like family protein n=1 Tax=Flavonifractor sp. An9 TaxID=1965664 RepID=UPI000B3718BC|nr:cytidylate kinase-like family protein [Flavonifractor sp. An9]OUN10635.1 hypothetical protein B5G40_09235 [Flavonifractor sp. An9]
MIITIARKYGSGGREIGQRLAKHLDIPYYNVDTLPHTRIEDWQEEILRLADAGPCVMVGFCADHVLAGREGLMRTFIHCDMEHRLQRIMEENHLSREQAQREALYQDRERARLYGLYTGEKWANLDRYDLTVNSSLLGTVGTVELLGQFVALNVMRKRRGQ